MRQALVDRLHAEKAALQSASETTGADRQPVALDQQSVGRLSRMDAMQVQAMAKAQETRRRQRLTLIDAALRRADLDEYGYCAACGEPIPEARLQVDPAAPCCVPCTGGAPGR